MRLKSRLKAYANIAASVRHNRRGTIRLPSVAHVIVTWRCNSHCQRCDIWQREAGAELSSAQWQELLPQLKCLDVIKLTGGEPLLKEDLPQLVTAIQDTIQPYLLQLNTNGLLPEKVKQLVEYTKGRHLHVRVSLDGWGEAHNRLRGREDAFAKARETLDILIALKKRYPLTVGVNYNVLEETLEDLPQVLSWCRREGINFVPGFPIKPFLAPTLEPQKALLIKDKERFRRNFLKIYKGEAGFNPVEAWILRHTTKTVFDRLLAEDRDLSFKCLELRNLIYLMPDGSVVTCGCRQEPVGNLSSESLDRLWFSERLQPFRREVEQCPGCLQLAIKIISRVYQRGW